jgi:uncharacterized protein (TIGR02118 family)
MYKVCWITRFKPGLAGELASSYWRDVHGPLGAKVPGVERYVQNVVLGPAGELGPSEEEVAFDGYSCIWYTDRDAFIASADTPEMQTLVADGYNVFDMDSMRGMSAALDERLIIDGPVHTFKAVWIVRFKDETRADPRKLAEAHEYWTNVHGGEFGVAVPEMDRYVQNHVTERIEPEGPSTESLGTLAFDGFSECWFADRGAFDRAMATPEWLAMNEDGSALFDWSAIWAGMSAILEERVIKG